MSNDHDKQNFLFFLKISVIEYYFQQVFITVLNIYFLPDAGENFIIFVNDILLFVHQLFAYHCWTPVYKVVVLLTALISLQAYFFFRLYKAHESYFCCLPLQYKIWKILIVFYVLRKNAIIEDLQAVNVEIKVTKKSERVNRICLFCPPFLKGHYREMVLFPKSIQAKKDFKFFAIGWKLAKKGS